MYGSDAIAEVVTVVLADGTDYPLNQFIIINSKGRVLLYNHRPEMGQGTYQSVPMILAEEGTLDLHGLAMRPSSPAGMGRIGESLVFLLPGNPVSCLCAYDFFAGRAIRQRGGRNPDWPHRTMKLPLSRKLVSAVGRLDYCRVMAGEDHVEPLALSGASILSSTTRANGFVIVPEDLEGYAPGEMVTVYLYD